MSPTAPRSRRLAPVGFRACASFALAWMIAGPAAAQSLADPAVRAGSASISGLGTSAVVVSQTTDKAVIDWRNFSVDAGSSVQFRQPGAGSIALNRITGTDATRIDGSLTGNGQVWLLNPNGVLIGSGGRVNVGGLIATTHSISNEDFLAGHYSFDGAGASGSVVNQGAIVADGGYAVLAGNRVANAGLVQARLGQVVLGAGKSFTVDLVGDKLLSFAVTRPVDIVAASGALVSNTGVLSAQGGAVVMTARAAADVVGSVVNTTGLIDATAVRDEGGTIVLDGGDSGLVYAAGLIDASGKAAGQTGGRIGVFGDSVVVGAGALLDASGSAGGGAINVGGGWQGASIDGHASAVRAGVAASATLDASAIDAGKGGEITLWSDVANAASQTLAYGTFLAKGGASGGDGGRIETSGHYLDTTGARGSAASRSATGAAGLWLLDPYNVEIVAAGSSSPTLTNVGFENGSLSGWTTTVAGGDAQAVTSASSYNGTTYAAQAGSYFALLTAGTVNQPNSVSQTFTATAGQSLTFYAIFLGKDYLPFNDTGTVVLTGPSGTQTLYSKMISDVGDYGTSPWQSQLITFTQSGTYTITAAATNIQDSGQASQLGFDLSASAASASLNGGFAVNGGFQTWTPSGSPSKIDVSQITGFLNGGTNVRVTTTGAGSEAGNITVNAAIAKTAGTAATLQLDATNAIIVNQAIGSTSNALNVTLNAGAGGIALNNAVGTNGGTLTLNTTGTTTQMVALTTGALVLNGTGGSHALTNAGNSFQTLSGSTGAISIANSAAATTLGTLTTGPLTIATSGSVTQTGALTSNYLTLNGTGGAYALTNSGNAISILAGNTGSASVVSASATSLLYLSTTGSFALASGGAIVGSGYNSFGGNATLTTANGITLASGSQIATAGTLALEGATFTNQSGASAISTSGSGRWLVYSQTPVNDSFGGLASNNNAVWNQTPTSTPPASAPSGNRYIFALSPTITVTPAATHKTYGDTLTAAGVAYTATGLINAATYGNVFTQDVLTGAPGVDSSYGGLAATAYAGAYQLHSTQGSLATTAGYGFVFGQSTLTVDPRQLILAAVTATKVYDGTTTTTAAPTASGLVNGNTVTNLSESFNNRDAGTKTLSVNAAYTINDGNGGNNYAVTLQTASGTITAKALTASLTGSVAKTYDGTIAASLASGNYALAGVVGTDSVALNNPTGGSYDTKNAGSGKTVTVGGLGLTGSDAGNYTVNASASAAVGSIAQRALTAGLTGSVAKTYDGTIAASLAAGNYTLANTVQGDNIALNNPTGGSYDTKNAGSGKTVTVGGLGLTGSDAGNYTVNASASAAVGSIAQRALTAGLTGSVAKTYDGTIAASLAAGNYTLANTVQGDNIALNNPTGGSYDTKNAGSGKTVTVGGLALTGSDAGNYTVNASASAAVGSIAQRALTAGLTGSVAKTYDGTIAASLAAGNYTLANTVQGDNIALNNPTGGSYDTKNAGSGKTVTVGGLALTGTDAGNYTVNASASAAVGSIAQRALTAGLTGSVAKTYDGTIAASLAAGNYTLANTVQGDNIALNNPTGGSYDTKNAGSGKTVTVGGLGLTGSDAGNYTVNASASAAVGSIAQRALTAGLTGSVAKTYDGTIAASLAASNYTLANTVQGDNIALNNPTGGSYDTKNAGSGKTVTVGGLGLTGSDAGNYTVNASASAAVGSIAQRALTAGLTGSVAKTYDGTIAASLAAGNYTLANTVQGDNIALNNPTGGSYDTKNAGSGKTVTVGGLALTGTDAGNYTVNASASAAVGSIAQRALTAGLTGSVAKTYDGTIAAGLAASNYTLANTVQGDNIALNNPTGGSYDTKNAGSGKTVTVGGLALTGTDAGNYTVNASASAAVGSIAQRALTAGLTGSVAKTYDGTIAASLAAGNYTLANTVQGDNIALNNPTGGSYDTKNAGSGKTVTVGGLALTGSDAGNYTVNASASAAVGSIAQRTLTAGLTGSVAKTYDGTIAASLAAGNYTLANTVQGDNIALNNPTGGSYDTKNAGSGKTVNVSGLSLTGADAANYTVNANATAAVGSIAQRTLTAGLTGSVAKTYDGTIAASLAASNYTLANTVQGDNIALNNPVNGSYDNKNAGTGKTVNVSGLSLTGADAANYTVNVNATAAVGSIAQRVLTAGLTSSVAKTYDGTTAASLAASNYTLANTVQGDSIALNNPTSGSYDNKNVGVGKTVTVGGLSLTGADAGNYTVNALASAAVGSVAAKLLTVGLTGTVSRTANGSTAAALTPDNFLLAGFVSGESASVTQTMGQYATASAGTDITVSTTLAAGDFQPGSATLLSNYVVPVGTVAGKVGTISPQVMATVVAAPAAPAVSAPAAAAIAATPVVPATPVAPSDAPAAAPVVVEVASAGGAPVSASPPSPVATTKPATPTDVADTSDPILATVEAPSDKPASHSSRQSSVSVSIAGGLLTEQRSLPPHGGQVPGVDEPFSGSGAGF